MIPRGVIRDSKQLTGLKETWYRLGRIDLASKPVIISLVVAHALTVFGFELGRVGERPLLTLAVAFMAEVLFWASYLTLYALQLWFLGSRSSVLVKVSIIILSNILRIVALEFALFQFGLVDQIRLADRILGDSTGILLLLLGIAYIQVALVDLGAQEADLERAREKLNEDARASKQSAENADRALRSKAQEVLGEQLKAIAKFLSSTKELKTTKLAGEIQDLIDTRVRPLSAELWKRLARLEEADPQPPSTAKSRFPRAIFPALDFRPAVIFPIAGLNIFVTAPGLADWSVAWSLGLWMLTFLLLGVLLTQIYPRGQGHGVWLGACLIGLFSVLAWVPSLVFLLVRSGEYPQLGVLSFTSTMVILLTALCSGLWSAFKRERTSYLSEIKALNLEHSRQLALIDQQVWVARRSWTFLVHGTVQGALSVALSRLQLAEAVTPEIASQVAQDVERARSALNQTHVFNQPWSEVWPQIEQTWSGVCAVTHSATAQAEQLLASSAATSTCVAEIAKELVSNAFRHGKATEVNIAISAQAGKDLLISATNNGMPVDQAKAGGIGSEMFGELTTSWGFVNTPQGPLFQAVVPVAANPSGSPASS